MKQSKIFVTESEYCDINLSFRIEQNNTATKVFRFLRVYFTSTSVSATVFRYETHLYPWTLTQRGENSRRRVYLNVSSRRFWAQPDAGRKKCRCPLFPCAPVSFLIYDPSMKFTLYQESWRENHRTACQVVETHVDSFPQPITAWTVTQIYSQRLLPPHELLSLRSTDKHSRP